MKRSIVLMSAFLVAYLSNPSFCQGDQRSNDYFDKVEKKSFESYRKRMQQLKRIRQIRDEMELIRKRMEPIEEKRPLTQEEKLKLHQLPNNPKLMELIRSHESYRKRMRQIEERGLRTKQELKKLDVHLRSIWNAMRAALSKGDIDLAVSYFVDRTKDANRKNFQSLSPEKLRRMAKDLGDIQLIKDKGIAVEYDIRIIKAGKGFSFYLLFQEDLDGKWKIVGF